MPNLKTILVGNGGGLRGSGLGTQIDDFDRVVRFNEFEFNEFPGLSDQVLLGHDEKRRELIKKTFAAGWQSDCGTKITHHMLHRRLYRKYCQGRLKAHAPVITHYDQREHPRVAGLEPAVELVGNGTLQAIRDQISAIKGKPFKDLSSSGLVLIVHAIREWGSPVWIVGFDSGKTGHYFNAKHRHASRHMWDGEAQLIQHYVDIGHVIRLEPDE